MTPISVPSPLAETPNRVPRTPQTADDVRTEYADPDGRLSTRL
ncbi:MAG TPA: hypothetical protein PKM88_02150 [bacterium]|nr:hypothetical protein [bacterium]